jgi:hypothetical protein
MSNQIDYKRKYIKYKKKYLNQKKYLQIQKGGTDTIIVQSNFCKTIHIKKPEGNNPGYMQFQNDIETGSIQSMYNINNLDHIYLHYFYPLLTFLQYINTNIGKILMVGLGGGNLPMLIRSNFPNCLIDIVEIDPAVVEASKIMGFSSDNKMRIHVCDGNWYLNNTNEKNYDCIILDLDSGPAYEHFRFGRITELLNDDGILAVNVGHHENILSKKLFEVFPCIKIYSIGQYVYICSKKNISELFRMPININTASNNMKKLKNLDEIIKNLDKMHSFVLAK